MYDLTIVKAKLNKWKLVICIVATAIVVSIATVDGIFCVRLLNGAKFSKQIVAQAEEIERQEVLLIEQQEALRAKLPTWKKMQGTKSIYAAQEEKRVFLTFDDGPSKSITPQILDLLGQENIKATFFVLGKNVHRYPEITKRAYEEGHFIANHGYSHNNKKLYESNKSFMTEINDTDSEIGKAIGIDNYRSHIFRFPNGYSSPSNKAKKKQCAKLLEKMDYGYIDWNCLNSDSVKKYTSLELLNNLKKSVKGKGTLVILMHDTADVSNSSLALKDCINFLKQEGYQFKTFYDLLTFHTN